MSRIRTLPLIRLIPKQPLLKLSSCPNCWSSFPPEHVLWISVHPKLHDDSVLPKNALGDSEPRRFIPERFDPEGRALDAEGLPCTQLACPRCRLSLPRATLELPSTIISLLGAQGSGKSVFLASLVFAMRQKAAALGLRFQDADLSLNALLLEDERKLFHDVRSDEYRKFTEVVPKTQLGDSRYRTTVIDGQKAKYLFPFPFLISPSAGHPNEKEEKSLSRLLCLYDNAGEHFRPGQDASEIPVTRHLAASRGLLFTFDPTADRRFIRELGGLNNERTGVERQDVILVEAANRIREHASLSQMEKIPQPLVVVLTKFDMWRKLVPKIEKLVPIKAASNGKTDQMNMNEIMAISDICFNLVQRLSPEIASTARSISNTVVFIPVAAVGMDVQPAADSDSMQFRGSDYEPYGVLLPLLFLLNKCEPKLVPAASR